jgi:hypothetical protein
LPSLFSFRTPNPINVPFANSRQGAGGQSGRFPLYTMLDWKIVGGGGLSCRGNIVNDTSVSEKVSVDEAYKSDTTKSVRRLNA